LLQVTIHGIFCLNVPSTVVKIGKNGKERKHHRYQPTDKV